MMSRCCLYMFAEAVTQVMPTAEHACTCTCTCTTVERVHRSLVYTCTMETAHFSTSLLAVVHLLSAVGMPQLFLANLFYQWRSLTTCTINFIVVPCQEGQQAGELMTVTVMIIIINLISLTEMLLRSIAHVYVFSLSLSPMWLYTSTFFPFHQLLFGCTCTCTFKYSLHLQFFISCFANDSHELNSSHTHM